MWYHSFLVQVVLPVELTRLQAGCYRTVLTRFYELLSDPKPPRHSGHRCGASTDVPQLFRVCTVVHNNQLTLHYMAQHDAFSNGHNSQP